MANVVEKQDTVWKTYPDYPFIEVNQFGQVRTRDRYVPLKNGGKRFIKGRILKQQLDNHGYMFIQFNVDKKKIVLRVHRIVAVAFIPNPNNLPEVNHRDNNPANNTVSNLEWCTRKYNIAYREKFGVPAKEASRVLRKSLIAINLETFKALLFDSQTEAGRQLGIDRSDVNKVVRGQRHKAGGYWFCYADENAVKNIRFKFGDDVANEVRKLMVDNL